METIKLLYTDITLITDHCALSIIIIVRFYDGNKNVGSLGLSRFKRGLICSQVLRETHFGNYGSLLYLTGFCIIKYGETIQITFFIWLIVWTTVRT